MPMEYSYRAVRNADNTDLGPLVGGRLIIGEVDQVNARGAVEISGFTCKRHELVLLAKYWMAEQLRLRWFYFWDETTGSVERRILVFAGRRVERMAILLGEDEMERAKDEVYDEFKRDKDPKYWEIYMNDDPEQRNAVIDEIWRRREQNDC